jgi:hypothetical protein
MLCEKPCCALLACLFVEKGGNVQRIVQVNVG